MTIEAFKASLAAPAPPADAPPPLQALWWLAKDDWKRAHEIAQSDESKICALVHAHLHRVEGDLANAGYWYRRAGREAATSSLDTEWVAIVSELLAFTAPRSIASHTQG